MSDELERALKFTWRWRGYGCRDLTNGDGRVVATVSDAAGVFCANAGRKSLGEYDTVENAQRACEKALHIKTAVPS